MDTESIRINLAQRILDLTDITLLKKISKILENENIVGYETNGQPIYEKDYFNQINESVQLFREGKLETYSTEEVKKQILDK